MSDGPRPNLFLIGVPKGATTTLATVLDESDAVCLGNTKEPGFLVNPTYNLAEVERLFSQHFRGCEGHRYRLDATPWTFYEPTAPDRILSITAAGQGPPRLLLSLREPLSRMASMYLDQVARGRERRSFEAAVKHALQNDSGPRTLSYVTTSLYGAHLGPWLRHASTLDLRIVFFDDIIDRERASLTLSAIGEWLDLSLGRLTRSNARSDQRALFAPPLDRAVALGSRVPPSIRARLRRPFEATSRQLLRWSPRRAIQLPSTEISDAGLSRELDEVISEDLRSLHRQLSRTGAVLLPTLPRWLIHATY